MMDSLNYLSFYNRRSKICVVYYPVCGIMYIKDPLLLIGKSSPRRGGSGVFSTLSEWSFIINVKKNEKNMLSALLNKNFPSFHPAFLPVCLPSREFAHCAMGRRIDPSWGGPIELFLVPVVLHDWCNKGRGMCYPVCGMVHIKEPLLLIGKSSLCGGSGIPLSRYLNGP